MPLNKNYRELNSVDLVKLWRSIVNKYVNLGRDAHLIKDALLRYTPVQILLGMYRLQGESLTIPIFLRNAMDWVELDENWAEVLLAIHVTGYTPPAYYVYMDLKDEQSSIHFQQALVARRELREWSDQILS